MRYQPDRAGRRAPTINGTERRKTGGCHSTRALLGMALPATLFSLGLLLAGPALADTHTASAAIRIGGEPSEPAWEPAPGLVLAVNDSLDPMGRIYDSPDFQSQLVVPGNGQDAFVLQLATQSVLSVPRSSLAWNGQDLPVPDLASALDLGGFLVDEGEVSFLADGRELRVEPEPPLVGEVSGEKLRAAKPDYVYAASRFQPEDGVIEALKSVRTPTEIVVFFGTWCATCKHYLPEFMRLMDDAKNPNLNVTYYGVSEDELEPKEAMKKYRNSSTPAFILLQGGKEIGRIEGEPLDSIGIDLTQILGVG